MPFTRVVGLGIAMLLCAVVAAGRAYAAEPGAVVVGRVDEGVAPGVRRATYRLRTAGGRVVAHVVFVDPRERSVHLETAVAHDGIGAGLETTLAMARRRHAVAAINGGYYAVGAGDVPLGVVVRDGRVLHDARGPALAVSGDGRVRIGDVDGAQLATVRTALGAGPMLLRGGVASAGDAGSPNFAERRMRIPASAVARLRDGRLALVAVDGRRPATSIGMNRAELTDFLRRLGAVDAMLLDSGGSTTLAARRAGDRDASLVNAPSDGAERPVADAILVVSDAPPGPPARLVLRPSRIVALPGTSVPVAAIAVDASGYPAHTAASRTTIIAHRDVAALDGTNTLHVGAALGDHTLLVERFGLRARLPLRTMRAPYALRIGPAGVNPNPSSPWSTSTVHLSVEASDARGFPVVVGDRVRWNARNAAIDGAGNLTVGRRNAIVTARVGGRAVTRVIPVGWHAVPLPLAQRWRFTSVPSPAPGDARLHDGALTLAYDFRGTERGAYAVAATPIALRDATAVACDVDGDAAGETVRLGFEDASGAEEPVTLVSAADFTGKRRVTAGIPIGLSAPRALRSIYAVGTLHGPRLRAAGRIIISACALIVPGT